MLSVADAYSAARARGVRSGSAKEACKSWLLAFLAGRGGYALSAELIEAATSAGISLMTITRARKALRDKVVAFHARGKWWVGVR